MNPNEDQLEASAGEVFGVADGDGLVFPSAEPHALWGEERFKMLLTMFK